METEVHAVRADRAPLGRQHIPADWPAEGPPPIVIPIEVQADGRVLVRHALTGATAPLDPGFLLRAVDPGPGADDEELEAPITAAVPKAPEKAPEVVPMAPAKAPKAEVGQKAGGARGCVTRTWGSVKGGLDVRIPARHTLILGDNATGKSTLINLVELALLGGASDIAGRPWASGPGLLGELIDPQIQTGLEAGAEVTAEDGTVFTFRFSAPLAGGKTGLGRARHEAPSGVPVDLPLRAVVEELRGSPERAQRFLLSVACGLTAAEVLTAMPPGQVERVQGLLQSRQHLPLPEALLAARADVAKATREAKAETTRIEAEIEAASAELGLRPTDADLEGAGNAANTLQGRVLQLSQQWAAYEANRQRPQELAQVMARIEALRAEAAALPAASAPTPTTEAPTTEAPLDPARRERLVALRKLVAHNLVRDDGLCGACGGQFAQNAAREQIRLIDALLQATAQTPPTFSAPQPPSGRTLPVLQAEFDRLLAHKTELESGSAAALPPATPLEQIRTELAAAQAHEAKLRAREMAWAGQDRRKQARDRAAGAHRDLSYLQGSLDALIAQRVSDAEVVFCRRVQRHLPAEARFWLDTRTGRYGLARPVGACPTCSRQGLVLDGTEKLAAHFAPGAHTDPCPGSGQQAPRSHTRRDAALSGVEWATVAMALAGACVRADIVVAPLIPEDRDWASDGRSLREALVGLSTYPGQILFPTATVPFRGVPKDWGVIVLAADGTVILNGVGPSSAEIQAAVKRAALRVAKTAQDSPS